MKRTKSVIFTAVLATFLLLSCLSAVSPAQEKKEDPVKILKEIAGDYDFLVQGQTMAFNFYEEKGKLFGAPTGETPEEIKPVEGKELQYEVTTSEGQYYQLEFVRNEQGKIAKCIIRTQGMEFEGIKK